MRGRRGKAVAQINPITGKVVATYDSICQAQRRFHPRSDGIYKCAAGKQRQAYGFRWAYLDESGEVFLPPKPGKMDLSTAIRFLTLNQGMLSWEQLAERTGYTVAELREIYQRLRLWRKGWQSCEQETGEAT